MILLAHILIATGSVFWSLYTSLVPTKLKLRLASVLIGSTLVSGTILVISMQAPLVKSCLTGLVFIGFSLASIAMARHGLAKSTDIVV